MRWCAAGYNDDVGRWLPHITEWSRLRIISLQNKLFLLIIIIYWRPIHSFACARSLIDSVGTWLIGTRMYVMIMMMMPMVLVWQSASFVRRLTVMMWWAWRGWNCRIQITKCRETQTAWQWRLRNFVLENRLKKRLPNERTEESEGKQTWWVGCWEITSIFHAPAISWSDFLSFPFRQRSRRTPKTNKLRNYFPINHKGYCRTLGESEWRCEINDGSGRGAKREGHTENENRKLINCLPGLAGHVAHLAAVLPLLVVRWSQNVFDFLFP